MDYPHGIVEVAKSRLKQKLQIIEQMIEKIILIT